MDLLVSYKDVVQVGLAISQVLSNIHQQHHLRTDIFDLSKIKILIAKLERKRAHKDILNNLKKVVGCGGEKGDGKKAVGVRK